MPAEVRAKFPLEIQLVRSSVHRNCRFLSPNRRVGKSRLSVCPCRLSLQSRGLGFKDLNLGLGLGLRRLAPLLGFLDLRLDLGVKLVDLFQKLDLPVSLSLGMF